MTTSSRTETNSALESLKADQVLQARYRIVRQLGKGGMGAVYEAVDQRLGITVALKETLSADANVRKQFEQEARLLASLQHQALPRVSDHFTEGNRAFLVMQFIAGVDLARIIYQQPGPFPREQVVAWADQLLDALIYLHSQDRQVIHRDIKPHNLKLTATGQIALLDFGLAKAQPAESSTTSSAPFFGYTRQYAPLEQIQALPTNPRCDIYALGATLYHLLTGVKPADALARAASLANGQGDPLKPANVVHPTVGAELSGILNKAMSQNPEQRYRSAAEFREALRRLGRRSPSRSQYKPSPAGSVLFTETSENEIFKSLPASVRPRLSPAFIASIMLIVLTAAGGVFYGYPQWRDWSAPDSAPGVREAAAKTTRTRAADKPTNNTARPAVRSTDGDKNSVSKPNEEPERRKASNDKTSANSAVAEQVQRLDRVKLSNPNLERQPATKPENKVEPTRRIKIPNIRLPAAENLDGHLTAPATKPQRLETYQPVNKPMGSWSRRMPDGLTVKFTNGSMQLFKPGVRVQ